MIDGCGWWRVGRELGRWAAAGHRPRLWWRDDDAVDVAPALVRLVSLAERFRVPLVLAVIPGSGPSAGLQRLGEFLEERPGVFVGQHGVTHADRRRPGEPRAEFPAWEAPAAIAAAVAEAQPRIAALPRALPLFVPPWNAAHPALGAALDGLGLALSAGAAEEGRPGAAPAEVDLMRWGRPHPGFRGRRRCLSCLRRALRRRRLAADWARPVGLLTHHLAHDAETWSFLEEVLARTHADPRVSWAPPPELFPAPKTGGETQVRARAAVSGHHPRQRSAAGV